MTANTSLVELHARVIELATLHALQRTYASPATESIARSRLSDARRALGLDGLLVLVRDGAGTRLSIAAAEGIRGDVALGLAKALAERRRGFITEPRIWPDLSQDPKYFEDISLPPEGSLAVLPLLVAEHVVGFLVLHAHRPLAIAETVITALAPVTESLATSLAAAAARLSDEGGGSVMLDRSSFLSSLAARLRRAGDDLPRQTVLVVQVEELRHLLATDGAAAGADVVESLGVHLRGLLRATDLLAHLEGGRVAVALGECSEAGARAVAAKLRDAVSALANRYRVMLGLSVGGVSCAGSSEEAEDLLEQAENLVDEALAQGGGRTLLRSLAPNPAPPSEARGVD